jgi:hypothetical protein
VVLAFEFGWADVPQVGEAPFAVVEPLQIGKNMLPRNVPGRVCCPITLLSLETGEKRLDNRAIPAIPLATHTARHLHALKGMLLNLTCVLTPSVRVVHQARLGVSPSESHAERSQRQFCGRAAPHGSSDNHAGVQVEHHGQI